MMYQHPATMKPGSEGWTSFSQIDITKGTISLDAYLWSEGDVLNRVLVTKSMTGELRVWSEDLPEARTASPTPALVVDIVIVPTISREEIEEAWEES